MSDPRTQVQDATGDDPARGPRRLARTRRALHHLGQLSFGCAVAALAAVLPGVAVLALGVNAPGWIAAELAQRINRDLAGQALGFAQISLRLDQGMAPRVTPRDVSVRGDAGQRLPDLSALDITLSRAGLLQGALRPAKMRLVGGRLVLRRQTSVALSIALDGMTDLQGTGPEQIGALLARPRFSALREVTADNLYLRYEDARADRAWTADGGQARLLRDGDVVSLRGNVTVLGARDYATGIEVNYTGAVGSKAAEFGFRFEDMPARDIAGQFPALVWLSALDAPISGALRAVVDASGQLGPVNATLQIGAGALQPNPDTTPIPFEAARSCFTYHPDAQEIRFSELSVDSSWGRARSEGTARLVGIEDGWPRELQARFTFDEIVADPADLYPEPVSFEGALMDLSLRLDPFELTMGAGHLADQGRLLRLAGDIRAGPKGWALSLEGGRDGIAPDRLLLLWPRATKPGTRDWIAENVDGGGLRDIQLALRAGAGAAPEFFLGFAFDDLSAVNVRGMPPIEAVSGHASIDDNRFVLYLEQGCVDAAQSGRVDISGSSFAIPDIRIRRGPAQARLTTSGSVTAGLSLLDAPPFRFLTKAGQPVTLAGGTARLEGRLDFPLKQQLTPEEVAFEVAGDLRDLRSETLLKGRTPTARRLSVDASDTRIEIGDWLRAPVTLIGRVDLRAASLFGDGGTDARGGPVALQLDALQLSDTIAIAPFTADLDPADGPRGRFTGQLNGTAPIRGDIVPQDGRAAFRIRSDDAGRLLAAAGLLRQSHDGQMTLTPATAPGSCDGVLEVTDLRVKDAPALAALLNTISVVGLLEQLGGQGLHLASIDARFRLTPTRPTLLEGSAVGASLGLSMDGTYALARRQMDMQGVISPVYVLNAIGQLFTRRGEELIGFNYTLKGPAMSPRVAVNPLSALTPGFLREMFRKPAPQVEGGGPTDARRPPETRGDGSQVPDLQGTGR